MAVIGDLDRSTPETLDEEASGAAAALTGALVPAALAVPVADGGVEGAAEAVGAAGMVEDPGPGPPSSVRDATCAHPAATTVPATTVTASSTAGTPNTLDRSRVILFASIAHDD